MWSSAERRSPRRPALTLAGQFLLLQLTVLLAVLAVASVVSIRQGQADFRDDRGVILRRGAEQLAGTEPVRDQIDDRPVPKALAAYTEAQRRYLDASAVFLIDPRGTILAGTDEGAAGEQLDLGDSTAPDRRAWTGDVDLRGERSVVVHVPVLSATGELLGIVVVAEEYPSVAELARRIIPGFATFLGLGLGLGVAGSWLLSRLIRRRTRGLEPAEIAALADQR